MLVMFVLCRHAKAGIGAALYTVGPRREMSQCADFSLACANIFAEPNPLIDARSNEQRGTSCVTMALSGRNRSAAFADR